MGNREQFVQPFVEDDVLEGAVEEVVVFKKSQKQPDASGDNYIENNVVVVSEETTAEPLSGSAEMGEEQPAIILDGNSDEQSAEVNDLSNPEEAVTVEEGEDDDGDDFGEELPVRDVVPQEKVQLFAVKNADTEVLKIIDPGSETDGETFRVVETAVADARKLAALSTESLDKATKSMYDEVSFRMKGLNFDSDNNNITVIDYLRLVYDEADSGVDPLYKKKMSKREQDLYIYDRFTLMSQEMQNTILEQMDEVCKCLGIYDSYYTISFDSESSEEDQQCENCMSLQNRILAGAFYPRISIVSRKTSKPIGLSFSEGKDIARSEKSDTDIGSPRLSFAARFSPNKFKMPFSKQSDNTHSEELDRAA